MNRTKVWFPLEFGWSNIFHGHIVVEVVMTVEPSCEENQEESLTNCFFWRTKSIKRKGFMYDILFVNPRQQKKDWTDQTKFVVWMNIIITMHGFAHGETTDLICLSLRWCSLWPPGVDLEGWSWATHSWMDRGQGRDFDQRTLGSVWVLWDPPRWLSKFLETSSSQFQTIASGRKQVYNFQSYWDSQIISF